MLLQTRVASVVLERTAWLPETLSGQHVMLQIALKLPCKTDKIGYPPHFMNGKELEAPTGLSELHGGTEFAVGSAAALSFHSEPLQHVR